MVLQTGDVKPLQKSQELVKKAEAALAEKVDNTVKQTQSLKGRLLDLFSTPKWMRHSGLEAYWSGERKDRIVRCWVRRWERDIRAIESQSLDQTCLGMTNQVPISPGNAGRQISDRRHSRDRSEGHTPSPRSFLYLLYHCRGCKGGTTRTFEAGRYAREA